MGASGSITTLFGTRLPIVQAPMAGAQGAELALAVCAAGGLGSLPRALLGAAAMRSELERIRQAAPGAVFNVNFFCHTPPVPDEAREAAWRVSLLPYYQELAIDPRKAAVAGGREPFSGAAAGLLSEFKPAVVSFHFGLPSPELLAQVRSWGAKIISSATTVQEGLWLQAHGVDAVIAQGLEAGGHRGMFLSADMNTQLGTMALLPQLTRKLQVPVIAAGGIADARGVSAAMALGAAGVQVGTAYLLCPQATTSAVHRAALRSSASSHTAVTNLFTGRPARGIVNRLMHEQGPMSAVAPAFPLAGAAVTPLRAAAEALGRGDFSPLWSGQNASGCRAVDAAVLTRELAGA